MAVVYGVDIGFCGCLTTMSTWVLELHGLPRAAAYVYGVVSVAAAALGPALFVELISGIRAASATAKLVSPPVNFCLAYSELCASTLKHIGCPPGASVTVACPPPGGLGTYAGICSCGAFDTSAHVAELIIDTQVKNNSEASAACAGCPVAHRPHHTAAYTPRPHWQSLHLSCPCGRPSLRMRRRVRRPSSTRA